MAGPFTGKPKTASSSPEATAAALNPAARPNQDAQRRQRMLMAIGASVIIAGTGYWAFTRGGSSGTKDGPATGMTSSINTSDTVNRGINEGEWIARSESELRAMESRLALLEKQLQTSGGSRVEVQQLREQMNRERADARNALRAYDEELTRTRRQQQQGPGTAPPGRPVPAAPPTAAGPGEPFPVAGNAGRTPSAARQAADGAAILPGMSQVRTISFGTDAPNAPAGGRTPTGFQGRAPEAPPTAMEASPDYLPPNSYAPATVIVGVDASTGVSSQTDPLPVLLRITGPARSVVSNGRLLTTRLEGCVINGAARGDLSSEKVYVKLVRMTCDQPGGRVAVSDVKGFLSFAGKTGVRGRVVSREGDFVSRAFLAGVVGGFGRAFSVNSQAALRPGATVVTGEGGGSTVPTLSPQQILTGGLGDGVATSGDMLSRYLIERAEQYQPVVEMPTGIEVHVVFLDGVYVRGDRS